MNYNIFIQFKFFSNSVSYFKRYYPINIITINLKMLAWDKIMSKDIMSCFYSLYAEICKCANIIPLEP